MTEWPGDADGDVFRALRAGGHNFDEVVHIDFNVDFDDWPPAPAFLAQLASIYPDLAVHEPDDEFNGYLQFIVTAPLTYDLVMSVQSEVSRLALPFGGRCESWGLFNNSGPVPAP